ncbi:hypothetical protein ICV35_26790 [Rhodococcus ruber]|uniref:hypothetical protein n=1 Tax=Rhodococcus ruber TaxID=1830 RepID=UPI00177F1058|nr:hypothetical protein [Rhodococcus ruber]MBD8057248.1 hypothetical protein [Rhodococcus ruber]
MPHRRRCGQAGDVPELVLRGVLGAWSALGADARIRWADLVAAWAVADEAERAELARLADAAEVIG